jgi:hypothetical protein
MLLLVLTTVLHLSLDERGAEQRKNNQYGGNHLSAKLIGRATKREQYPKGLQRRTRAVRGTRR